MNRTQRRQLERQGQKIAKPKIITLPENRIKQEVDKYQEEIRKMAVEKTVKAMLANFALVLSDDFGFGKVRISKALETIKRNFLCINEELLTLDDVVAWCNEKGIGWILEEADKNY